MKALLKMGILSGILDIRDPRPEIHIPLSGGFKDTYTSHEMNFPKYDDTPLKRMTFRRYRQLDKDLYEYIYEGQE